MTAVEELLARKFESGVNVVNCMKHMRLDFDKRPDGCPLCQADIRNHLQMAIRANAWLRQWKEDATKILESPLLLKD